MDNVKWKKNITFFLLGQAVSLFGSSLVQYAIMWHITLKTQSGTMMTISIICGFLPTFFLSPFAGVWADRFNRKNLIIISDSMIALTTLLMAILFMLGYKAIWLLFLVSAVRALGTGVQTPSIGAFIPQIVPEEKLTKANAVNATIQSAIMMVSPMVSGALLTFTSIEIVFFIDVVTAAIAVFILLLFLHVPPHEKASAKQETGYFADMRLGFQYMKNHAYIKIYFIFSAIFLFFVTPAAFLTPLQVARTFGPDVWRLTAIEIVFSVGMTAGGALMTVWGGFKNKVYTMGLSNLLIGACTFALGVAPLFWIYLAFMCLTGISIPIFNTPAMVLLQENVEPDFLGRVFGVFGMVSSSMMPLGMLIFGPLSDAIRIEWLLIATGLLLFVQSILFLNNKPLIEAGKPKNK